jgi:hypothetical protein
VGLPPATGPLASDAATIAPQPQPTGSTDFAAQLEAFQGQCDKLNELLEKGYITREIYERKIGEARTHHGLD